MLDQYIRGEVRRISPEAPIPILNAQSRTHVLGGAANVAHNAVTMGARTILLGVYGEDSAGATLREALSQHPKIVNRLVPVPGRPTTVKTRFVSNSHQLLRVDEEDTSPVDAGVESQLMERYLEALEDCQAVVISDYRKGVLTDRVLTRCIQLARATGKTVVVDPKRMDLSAYRGASVITPNALEISRATGMPALRDEDAESAGRRALALSGADAVLLKRSEKGLLLIRDGVSPVHYATRAQEVSDVSGAGDTLVTAFSLALASGAEIGRAAQVGNAAAGVVVGKPGTATVTMTEIQSRLKG